jgi:hypothetical protein
VRGELGALAVYKYSEMKNSNVSVRDRLPPSITVPLFLVIQSNGSQFELVLCIYGEITFYCTKPRQYSIIYTFSHSEQSVKLFIDPHIELLFFLYGAAAHIGPWPPLYEVP